MEGVLNKLVLTLFSSLFWSLMAAVHQANGGYLMNDATWRKYGPANHWFEGINLIREEESAEA